MARILPDEMYTKVQEPLPKKPPVSRARLLRAMENIDRAQTRTDQEAVERSITESTKKAITPSLIDGLELGRKAGPSFASARAPVPDKRFLAGPPPPDKRFLAEPPVVEGRPAAPEGERVFPADEDLDLAMASLKPQKISDVEVLGEVPEAYWKKQKAVKEAGFGESFKAARERGLKEFEWQGKSFTTKMKEESEKPSMKPLERISLLTGEAERIIPEVGKGLRLTVPDEKVLYGKTKAELLAEEDELMGGVNSFLGDMQIKKGANTAELRPEMGDGFDMVRDIYLDAGVKTKDMEVTDGKTNRGYYTLHDVGLAADFGWKNLSEGQQKSIRAGLDAKADSHKPLSGGGHFWKLGDYDVLIHKEKGNEWHFHLENEALKLKTLGTKKEYEARKKQ